MAATQVLSIEELNALTRNPKLSHDVTAPTHSQEDARALWARLITTVHNPTVSDKHMTAACNAICYVVRAYARSSDDNLRVLAFSASIWADTFSAARSAFAAGKSKPALQVLDTIDYLAHSSPVISGIGIQITTAATDMANVIFSQQPRRYLKEACAVLYFFARKLSDIMSISDVLNKAYADSRVAFERLCHASGILIAGEIDEKNAESKSSTLKLLSLLSSLQTGPLGVDMTSLTTHAIDLYSSASEISLDGIVQDVLPTIASDQGRFRSIVESTRQRGFSRRATLLLYFAQLRFGKLKGYISEEDLIPILDSIISEHTFFREHCKYDRPGVQILLRNNEPSIRQSICELLTCATSMRMRVPSTILGLISAALPFLHDDIDAFHRGELYSTFRRFWLRLQHRQKFLRKDLTSGDEPELSVIDGFLNDYLSFLRSELAPHLSYGRHILSLDLLCYALQGLTEQDDPLVIRFAADLETHNSLLRLIIDPYDDIRSQAARTLSAIASAQVSSVRASLKLTIQRSQPLASCSSLAASTNRADHADALGRVIALTQLVDHAKNSSKQESIRIRDFDHLVNRLDDYLESKSSFDVASTYPLHGNILGLAYLLGQMKPFDNIGDTAAIVHKMLNVCRRIWALAQPHLCIDSPEMEKETNEDETISGPKDLLAYAWRALRDSNILLQSMLQANSSDAVLLASVGDLGFEQLRLLRHRGAFSTVGQTFLLCCQKARYSNEAEVSDLPGKWFSNALTELEVQADRLTRRSAGLPAIFAAVLDPSNAAVFATSFDALCDIATQQPPLLNSDTAEDKLRLPQVHALNSVKDIIMNSRFRTVTQPLVDLTINMAARCMGSEIWAIKNCGLMLLRASINRLDPSKGLETSESGIQDRFGGQRIRTPLEVALYLLDGDLQNDAVQSNGPVAKTISAEAEFAGLDLLGRLYIVEYNDERIVNMVMRKLSHPLWHVRAQAARLLAAMAKNVNELDMIQLLLKHLPRLLSSNECHGRLFAVQCILDTSNEEVASTSPIFSTLFTAPVPAVVKASYTLRACWLSLATRIITGQSSSVLELSSLISSLDDGPTQNTSMQQDSIALYQRGRTMLQLRGCPTDVPGMGSAINDSLREDDDSAVDALQHLNPPLDTSACHLMVNLILESLQPHRNEDVQVSALQSISATLKRENYLPSEEALGRMLGLVEFVGHLGRDLLLEQLRLYASLCAHLWKIQNSDLLSKLSSLSKGFCLHLRHAVNDSYEEPTRRAAAEALLEWKNVENLDDMIKVIFGPQGELDLTSSLYDLLNDDDSEIRILACVVTAYVLRPLPTLNATTDVVCAAASRLELRSLIQRNSSGHRSLALESLRRILGLNMATSPSRVKNMLKTHVNFLNVKRVVNLIKETANDLFAEEKQNLYLDEFAELQAWSGVLSLNTAALGHMLHDLLCTRAAEALVDLIAFMDSALSSAVEANIIRSFDFELLAVRVVSLARIMDVGGDGLEVLHRKCSGLNMPTSVTAAFTWSL